MQENRTPEPDEPGDDTDMEPGIEGLLDDLGLIAFPPDYKQPELEPTVRRIIYGE